jgi:hypothetical protein
MESHDNEITLCSTHEVGSYSICLHGQAVGQINLLPLVDLKRSVLAQVVLFEPVCQSENICLRIITLLQTSIRQTGQYHKLYLQIQSTNPTLHQAVIELGFSIEQPTAGGSGFILFSWEKP